jgi:protein-S-isoprenylcysteine O-methyltransferase Ste14
MFLILLNQIPSFIALFKEIRQTDIVNRVIFVFVLLMGIGFTVVGGSKWEFFGFLGLKPEDEPLNTEGIYKFSRHPVYTGILLILFSPLLISLNENSLSWTLGAGGYFVLGSFPEEMRLSTNFSDYEDYKSKVGRFFPWRKKHFYSLFF